MFFKRNKHIVKALRVGTIFLMVLLFLTPTTQVVALIGSGNTPTVQGRVERFLHLGQWNQAIALMEGAFEEEPGSLGLQEKLLQWYILMNNRAAMDTVLAKAELMASQTAHPAYLQGLTITWPLVDLPDTENRSNKVPSLNGLTQQAEMLDPASEKTHYLAGMAGLWAGNVPLAEEELLKGHYQNPAHLKTLQALALIYLNQGKTKQPTPLLLEAYEENPIDVDTLFLLGRLYYEKEDPEKAVAYFRQSESRDPIRERRQRALWLARAYQDLGQVQLANEYYQIAEQKGLIPPEREQQRAQTQLARPETFKQNNTANPLGFEPALTAAQELFWTGTPSQGLTAYTELLQVNPQREDILSLLAAIHYRRWVESGTRPAEESLTTLISDIQRRQAQHHSPALDLAAVQLAVVQQGFWTPQQRTQALQVIQTAPNTATQLEGLLMLNCVADATALYNRQGLPLSHPSEVQRLALQGALPWLNAAPSWEQASTSTFGPLWNDWVQTWSARQQSQADNALRGGAQALAQGQPESARNAFYKALIYHRLSAPGNKGLAESFLQLNRLARARLFLQNAAVLNTSPVYQEQIKALFATMDKQIKANPLLDDDPNGVTRCPSL
jgi:tetratricopeptide (TPR) repeat protein